MQELAIGATIQESYRSNNHVVAQRLPDGMVLVDMLSNRIYELNPTAARLWELLETTPDICVIKQAMLQEFEVEESLLQQEIAKVLSLFAEEGLVDTHEP